MKIRTFSAIAVAFMLVSLLAVSAMAVGQERGAGMNSFIDADGDGVCDNLIDADGDDVCDNFIDEDGDGINDNSLGLGHGSRDGNGDKKQERRGDRTCIE
ncbi:hypothetical protein [Methanococcoides alaskense]|uniref:Uncharacterized protein n=1 Tax=Methanococcoides alaskense TaxID=325778 RepID=A0AA90TZU6_9EURY|nr:hypothetical protein [Methanococcoides alaskense]MDA0524429.1 hypothetical protein [Methanococcoides alaskense]MDR6223246.1 hypothetical protein [Methanococcoides alaskense]